MSTYTYIVVHGHVEDIEFLNDAIRCGGFGCLPSLTSAEQIISISKSEDKNGFEVFWRVREWKDGGQYDNQSV